MQNVGKLSRENKYGTGFIRLTIRKSPSGGAGIRARESPAVATVSSGCKKKKKKEKTS